MKDQLYSAISEYEKVAGTPAAATRDSLASLHDSITPVQEAYVGTIQIALGHLARADIETCGQVLRDRRAELETVREEIAALIQRGNHGDSPYLKLVLEFLYMRSRLIEELQMFPTFGLSMLERYSIEQSIDETITHLEGAMTGKKRLFFRLNEAFEALN